jgi:hypothetical protein
MAMGESVALDYRRLPSGERPKVNRRRLWEWPLIAVIWGPVAALGILSGAHLLWMRFDLPGSGHAGEFVIVLGMWGIGICLFCPVLAFFAAVRRTRCESHDAMK